MRKSSQETLINKFKVIVDTREQTPYKFKGSIIRTLSYGDYTLDYENISYFNKIIIERKSSVSELFAATGSSRERWEREMEKLRSVDYKWILCEFNFKDRL